MPTEALEIGGCEITVERFGSGPPIVVLHGEEGPRPATAFLEELGSRFEVHVPRHAGWAETRRAGHVRTVRDLALVAQEYVEGLGGPVPLVGLSFGGWLAAEIAANSPLLVSRLTLISPIGVKIGGREDRDFADLYILAAADRTALYYAPGKVPVQQPVGNADIYMERAIADEAIVRFCWQPYMHDPGLAGRLRRVRAPTLILSGDRDRLILNPGYYDGFAALIPGAVHEVVAGAGHRLEEEEPQAIARRVTQFAAADRPAVAA
jgi:pimeloyl-ACP methyl ester carboxylesterase